MSPPSALTRSLRRCGVLLAGWLALVLLTPDLAAQTTSEPPRRIRVVMDANYPPYSFRSEEGKLQGILIDQWQAWEKTTGIKVELHALDWAEALRRMREGEFDVIDSIVETTARREYFDFSAPIATMEVSVFFRKDISGITDLASLKGFPVAIKMGDQHIDILQEHGVTTLIHFPNHAAIIDAARERKINVFLCGAPSAHYHLNKAGIDHEFRQSEPISRNELRRAVRKGDTASLDAVTDGFAAISPDELERIDEKWFGRPITTYGSYLAYAGYAAAVATLLIGALAGWNRTLRKKIQQRTAALSESEQRFRQIAENLHEVFWLTTADGTKKLYVSPAYETVWGRSCASLYQDADSFAASIHPDERAQVLATIARDRARGFDVEYRVVKPDGSIRWIRDRGFPIKDHAGQVYRIAGIAEDITDRKLTVEIVKQAEDRVRQIIDTIPSLAWSVLPNGEIDFVNQRWMDYTGLSLEQEREQPTLVLHPDDVPGVMEKWRAAMTAREPFEGEMRLQRADGVYRWFLVRTVPLRDARGDVVKWFGTSIDIEDRKEAEELLQLSKLQLRALVERLHTAQEDEAKRIARELHDDLGQQLTALNLQLDNLELKLVDATPSQRAQIEGMHAVVNHTIEVVQTIASDLRLGQLDLLGLTAAIDWQLKEFSRRSSIPCEVPRLDEIANLSDAQNTAVFRILQEALTNIIRHAGATKVEVSLQARPGHLALKVRDNGRGITAAELNDRKSIGLLGMRERAERVGGTITVTGGAGEGTTVLVTIPLNQVPPTPA